MAKQNRSIEINSTLVPEFPYKKRKVDLELCDPKYQTSSKCDYFALSKDRGSAFLIELKTDMASISKEQRVYLDRAARSELRSLVIDVLEICGATAEKAKYVHLLKLLSDIHLVEYDDGLFPVKPGYSKVIKRIKDKVERRKEWPSLEVVYVQPEPERCSDEPVIVIDFKEFAKIIERPAIEKGESKGIRCMFACYLREWVHAAGSRKPGKLPPC